MKIIHYSIFVIFVLILLGAKNNYKPTDRTEDIKTNRKENANCAFLSDSCGVIRANDQIELFDTTDCVFNIFSHRKNLKYIEARAARSKQNQQEIPLNTMGFIAKNDRVRSESYHNRLIGLGFKKYYISGQLRACGFEISDGKVGKWKYYSAHGELDSIVDYNSNRGMTYCEFFEIAHAFGMVGENSRIPERKRFFEIEDSLGLKSCNPNKAFSNSYWRNFDFYPIYEEEENGRFNCKITYSKWPEKAWNIEKHFTIQGKSLCFYLSLYPETKEVCIYECHSVQ
jgi:hypothetical protein